MKYCFHCKNKLEEIGFMYSLDRPYVNLFFHLFCIAKIKEEYESLDDYAIKNYEKIKTESKRLKSKR